VDIEREIAALAEDVTSGAAELLERCLGLLAALCQRAEVSDEQLPELLQRTTRAAISARPAMAGFVNLAAAVFGAAEGAPRGEVRQAVLAALGEYRRARDAALTRVAERGCELLRPGGALLTISRSSTVLACLMRAADVGMCLRVICSESRPMCEGVELARELAALGHRPAVVADALAPALVQRAAVVLVGGDTVFRRGLVNKAGTYALALAAREAGVPIYALCPTEKFLAPAYEKFFENPAREPKLLLDPQPEGVEVWNYFFDITPLELLSGVVCEDGVLGADEVRARLEELPVVERLAREEARGDGQR